MIVVRTSAFKFVYDNGKDLLNVGFRAEVAGETVVLENSSLQLTFGPIVWADSVNRGTILEKSQTLSSAGLTPPFEWHLRYCSITVFFYLTFPESGEGLWSFQ